MRLFFVHLAIVVLILAGIAVGWPTLKRTVVQPIKPSPATTETHVADDGTEPLEQIAFALEKTGRFNEAASRWETLLAQTGNVMYAAFAMDAYYKCNAYPEALRMNAVLIERDRAELPDHLYNQGCLYACAGDRDNAMRFLDAAVAEGWCDPHQVEEDLKHDLKNLRDDPRFLAWRARLTNDCAKPIHAGGV